jgi:ABC-type transporter Mla maintaining outer membrane lipid asymmetry permease subunit MlaE
MLTAIFIVLGLLGALLVLGAIKAISSQSYWDNVAMRWLPTERRAAYIGEAAVMAAMALFCFVIPIMYWLDGMQ